jgi:hypothetical protein
LEKEDMVGKVLQYVGTCVGVHHLLVDTIGIETHFDIQNDGYTQGEDEGGVGLKFRSWSGCHSITSSSLGSRQYEGELGKEDSRMRSMVCPIEQYEGSLMGWGMTLKILGAMEPCPKVLGWSNCLV